MYKLVDTSINFSLKPIWQYLQQIEQQILFVSFCEIFRLTKNQQLTFQPINRLIDYVTSDLRPLIRSYFFPTKFTANFPLQPYAAVVRVYNLLFTIMVGESNTNRICNIKPLR